jgi:hypothetical protein
MRLFSLWYPSSLSKQFKESLDNRFPCSKVLQDICGSFIGRERTYENDPGSIAVASTKGVEAIDSCHSFHLFSSNGFSFNILF